jgi:hypothetical protein
MSAVPGESRPPKVGMVSLDDNERNSLRKARSFAPNPPKANLVLFSKGMGSAADSADFLSDGSSRGPKLLAWAVEALQESSCYFRCPETCFVISNMVTWFLPPKTALRTSSALISVFFFAS